ncbi:protein of unknown function [Burkholderia multivorans]
MAIAVRERLMARAGAAPGRGRPARGDAQGKTGNTALAHPRACRLRRGEAATVNRSKGARAPRRVPRGRARHA